MTQQRILDQKSINTIRFLAADAVQKARSGHPGTPMGAATMAYTLWDRFLKHNPTNPGWPDRDRFILSPGHASMLLYALLHLTGYDLSLEELQNFRQWGSKTPGHPEYGETPGVEVTTGPLGQGFAHGVGMAIAERWLAEHYNRPEHEIVDHYTYAIVSDGDMQEGVTSEAASLAGTLGLGKLIYIYDDNDIQIEGRTDIAFGENVAQRFDAYGWQVIGPIDGNDISAIEAAIRQAQADTERPSLIIWHTQDGPGVGRQAGAGGRRAAGDPLPPGSRRGRRPGHVDGEPGMTLQYWFMFPAAVLIATIAMASGVGGATFFSPLLILALGLPPEVAIGTGLITEVFGFASGLYACARKRLIDYRLGLALLVVSIPAALLGTWAAGWVAPDILKVTLGVGLFAVALSFLRAPEHKDVDRMDAFILQEYGGEKAETSLVTADGEEIRYTVCNRTEGRLIAGIGGLFVGLISTGLGELNGYFLLQRCRVPSKVSVATSVFVVALTVLFASAGHFVRFAQTGGEVLTTVLSLVVFTVPGVILGAQLGSRVGSHIPQKVLERGLGVLFVLVATLTLGEVIL